MVEDISEKPVSHWKRATAAASVFVALATGCSEQPRRFSVERLAANPCELEGDSVTTRAYLRLVEYGEYEPLRQDGSIAQYDAYSQPRRAGRPLRVIDRSGALDWNIMWAGSDVYPQAKDIRGEIKASPSRNDDSCYLSAEVISD